MNGQATVLGGHAILESLSNNVFLMFQAIQNFFEKSHWRSRDSGRRSRDRWMTVKQRFSVVSSNSEKFWKKSLNVTRQWSEVTRPLDDCQTTFLDVSSDSEKFWKKVPEGHATVVGGHATVVWLSNNVFLTFQAIREIFENKSLKVTREWSEVTRPLDDCQATFFWRFKQFGNFLKKVTEGHATVVGGHATVGWLLNNFFRRFKHFGKILKKVTEGHATVVGGHATVVWLSTIVFLTFQAIRNFFEKSPWKSRGSGRRSRDRWMTVKQRFFDVSSNSENFWKKSLKVTRQWSEVTRPFDDCQTTFFDVSSNSENLWKKSLKVTRQWSEVKRPLDDCQTTFLRLFKQFGKILKKVTEGHAAVVGGHTTVGWLSNNYFRRFKQFGKFLKKVAEWSRDSGRRSRDRRMTVKQRS